MVVTREEEKEEVVATCEDKEAVVTGEEEEVVVIGEKEEAVGDGCVKTDEMSI